MLRSWHQERGEDELFERLDLVLVTSLEPHQLIDDAHQSPFNVGNIVRLYDFTRDEAELLNVAYGSPLEAAQLAVLQTRVGGHPRLLQTVLHQIAKAGASLDLVFADALQERGSVGDHLHSLSELLMRDQTLRAGIKAVLANGDCDYDIFLKLRKLGLVKREGTTVLPRCNLYKDYFRTNLKV
jgi:murein L,D-transpeptidase YcbB/YkuD